MRNKKAIMKATALIVLIFIFVAVFLIIVNAWSESFNVDLRAYYKLDETSGSVVDSAHGNNGVVSGALQGVPGKIGTAYYFDGINDYVSIVPNNNFNFSSATNTMSVGAWVLINSTSSVNIIVDNENNWMLYVQNGKFVYGQADSGNLYHRSWSTTNTAPLNTWTFIVATYDGGDTTTSTKIYVNGGLVSAPNDALHAGWNANGNNFSIGISAQDFVGSPFNGSIDEVFVYNRTLSSTEVSDLYNAGSGNSYSTTIFDFTLPTSANGTTIYVNSSMVNVTLAQNVSSCKLSWATPAVINYTMTAVNKDAATTAYYNVSGLINNTNYIYWVWCNNTLGISNQTANRTLKYLENAPAKPSISFISPVSINYNNQEVLINISSDVTASSIWWYNGTNNLTYTNELLYNFTDGPHTIIAYANNSVGDTNSTSVTFSVLNVGDGTLGNLTFTTGTKTYGSMVNGIDYSVSGNTLYLFPDRYYNFTTINIGTGTTVRLASSATNGSVLYLRANTSVVIAGTISLDGTNNPFTYGDQVKTNFNGIVGPGVANGGSGGAGAGLIFQGDRSQGNGFGGGGSGGGASTTGPEHYNGVGGAGSVGGLSPSGGEMLSYSWNGRGVSGNAGSQSGGGSGGSGAEGGTGNYGYGQVGGATWGQDGSAGSGSGTLGKAGGGGGGGAGGRAGKQGINFYLYSNVINFTGTIDSSGSGGLNAGAGGDGFAYGGGGGGGGASGGGNAGNIKFYYLNSITNTGTKTQTGGNAGNAGGGGSNAYIGNGNAGTAGSAGSAGTFTLLQGQLVYDTTPPYFVTIPAATNINYTQGFGVLFNATDETLFDSYTVNDTTRFNINSTGYLKNITQLKAGIYNLNITINDSSNNKNSTIYVVTVNKALSEPVMSLTATTPINYGTTTNFIGSGCPGQIYCSVNISNGIFRAGTISANYSTIGNENYSSGSKVFTVTINKASTSLGLTATTPINYGTTTNFAGGETGCNGQLTCSLNITDSIFRAGTISANYSTGGNENYTGSSAVYTVTINKAIPNIVSTVTTPIAYGTTSDFTCSGTNSGAADLTYNLNQTNRIYPAGVVSINCSTTGGQNYTSNSTIKTLTINKVASQTSLTFDKTSPQVYGTAITPTCGILIGGTEARTLTNGTSGSPETLAGKIWNFNCSYAGNENYTGSSNITTFTITPANSVLYLYLNNSRNNITVESGTSIWLNTTLATGVGNIQLYKNSSLINNGASPIKNYTLFNIGYYNITASYSGNENYSANSSTYFVNTVDTTPPYFTVNANQTLYNNQSLAYQVNATDETAMSGYTVNDTTNFAINSTGWLTNKTALSVGIYSLNITINDSSNNKNSTLLKIMVLDTTPPYFNPTPVNQSINYGQGFMYDVNATDETLLDSYTINDSRFSINSTGGIVNLTSLAGGTIWLNVTINDSSNNRNSLVFALTVNKASTTTTLTKTPASPITYPTTSNFSCSNTAGLQSDLFINGVNKTTQRGLDVIRAAGTYTVNCTFWGNENYSTSSQQVSYTINKLSPEALMSVSGTTPITYGTITDVLGSETNTGDEGCTYTLNISNAIYKAGITNFNYSTTGCENYSSGSKVYAVTINKNSTTTTLTTSPATPIEYPQISNFSCSNSLGAQSDLFINGVNKTTQRGLDVIRAAGTYTVNCTFWGNENYSTSSQQASYVINKNSSLVLSLTATTPINYGTTTNFVGSGCPAQLTCNLNISNAVYKAGIINANYSTTGNENYSSTSAVYGVTINKIAPTAALTKSTGSWIIIYGTSETIGLSESNTGDADVTYVVYRNNVSKATGETVILAANSYVYLLNTTGGENYTNVSSLDTQTLIINKANSSIILYLNNSNSNYSYNVNNPAIDVNSTLTIGVGLIQLYKDNALINNGTSPIGNTTSLGIGYYNFTVMYSGNENYTSNYSTRFANITDINFPTVTQLSPSNNTYSNTTANNFTGNMSDTNLANATLYIYNATGLVNQTEIDLTAPNSFVDVVVNLFDGVFHWFWSIFDTSNNNQLSTNYTMTVDTTYPLISIDSSSAVNNLSQSSLFVNVTVTEINEDTIIFNLYNSTRGLINQTKSTSKLRSINYSLSNGIYYYNVSINDSARNKNNTITREIILDTTAPALSINLPTLNQQLATNNTVSLNYSVLDILTYVSTCWYSVTNITGSLTIANTTITNCENVTFGVPFIDMDYIIYLYVNDSLNNINLTTQNFSIRTTSPTISLDYPLDYPNSYFNHSNNISIKFTTTDLDGVATAQLWLNGIQNYTWNNPNSGIQNYTILNLSEGTYIWNINATDALGNSGFFTENYTFIIDLTYPTIKINSITTTSGSQIISFNSTTTDTNIKSCRYVIYSLVPAVDSSSNFACNSTKSASVSSFATYNLSVCALDYANWENCTSQQFTTSSGGGPSGGGGGGGGPRPLNTSNLTANICGNHICEPNSGEDYLTCPEDCAGVNLDASSFTDCFTKKAVEEDSKCIFKENKSWVWVVGVIIGILVLTLFFKVKERPKRNYSSISPAPVYKRKR